MNITPQTDSRGDVVGVDIKLDWREAMLMLAATAHISRDTLHASSIGHVFRDDRHIFAFRQLTTDTLFDKMVDLLCPHWLEDDDTISDTPWEAAVGRIGRAEADRIWNQWLDDMEGRIGATIIDEDDDA